MKKLFLLGVKGREWNNEEIALWRSSVIAQGKVRDYGAVVSRMQALPASTHIVRTYGDITVGNDHYRMMNVTVGDLSNGKPNILLLGGMHGYEPSGVEAVLRFVEKEAPSLTDKFNFLAFPALTQWAYEYNHRWTATALDPNREVKDDGGSIEIQMFMRSLESTGAYFALAVDEHETSDLDIGLRQQRAERFNQKLAEDFRHIPQGYYLTLTKGETEAADQRQILFGTAIMDRVKEVSPIAPDEFILGSKSHGGIILPEAKPGFMRHYLGSHARLVAVTEVYPDHPDMGFEKSVQAQLSSIRGGIDFVLNH